MAGMEDIVRPWVNVTSTPTPLDVSVPPIVNPISYIRWGAQSQFKSGDFRDKATDNPGFNTEDDQKPQRKRLHYSESARSFEDIRVENPDDPNQYVIVRYSTGMVLDGPNNVRATFGMSGPESPGTVEGEGQEPPTPPIDEIE